MPLTSIRPASAGDSAAIEAVLRAAFGSELEPALFRTMLDDKSAAPLLSLIAEAGGRITGHILFSKARLEPEAPAARAALLAPLAVAPDVQRHGIGGRLVARGLRYAADAGTDIVFVLGDPAYYRRHGFEPAARFGFEPPHAIPAAHADAWMVRFLRNGGTGSANSGGGRVACCESLDRPEFWRE